MDSQDGLNYLGRIIACCSLRIVSRTGGVVVCTLSLHAEGPWFKSWQVVHADLEYWHDSRGVERFCHKIKQEKSQDTLGKDVCNSLELKWLKARVSSLIWKNKFFEHNWVFSTHMASNFGRFGQLWMPNQENFYQHEKLNLNAVHMRTISSEDIEKWHSVARELWSWNSAYSITFWPCHQIQLERMSIFILFWDMMP